MKYVNQLKKFILNQNTTRLLLNLILVFGIIYLGYLNIPVIKYIIDFVWIIFKPFIIGFVIAYVLDPLIFYLQNKGLPRSLSLVIIYVLVLIILSITMIMVIPILYQRASELFISLNSGLIWIQELVSKHTTLDTSSIVQEIINAFNSFISSQSVVNITLDVLSGITSTITNYLIYFIVAIYISSDYPRIHHKIKMLAYHIDEMLPSYMRAIDMTMVLYIRSFSFVILIQTLMCGAMYFVVGHPNWLVLAILSGISSLVPYIGPLIVNAIALLTALNLGTYHIIILIFLILIQSNVMGYAVMPKVFSRGLNLSPIAVIFGLLTGFTIWGPIGMLIAMPILIVLKVIISLKQTHF